MNEQERKVKEIIEEAKRVRKRLKQHNLESEEIRTNIKYSGKQPSREGNDKPSSGPGRGGIYRNRSGSRVGQVRKQSLRLRERTRGGSDLERFRTSRPSLKTGKQIRSKNNLILQKIKNTQTGITNNYSFNAPMPRMETEIQSLSGIDKVRLRGSEYLTSISVRTTAASPVGTAPGDVLYVIPLNPHFLSGTRLLQLARLYTKYKWRHFTVEYIPVVPSTQNGSVIMYFSYDPEEHNFLNIDQDDRLRRALAHLGAVDFNVFSYGKATLVDDKQIGDYYLNLQGDVRFENQGTLYVVAGSSYSPSMLAPTEIDLELGQLIIHYDLELEERALVEDVSSVLQVTTAMGGVINSTLVSTNDPTVPFGFLVSELNTLLGTTLQLYHVVVIIPSVTFLHGAGVATNSMLVRTDNTQDGGVPFFNKGSVWYLKIDTNSTVNAQIFDNLEGALTEVGPAHVVNAITQTDVISGSFRAWVYDTRN